MSIVDTISMEDDDSLIQQFGDLFYENISLDAFISHWEKSLDLELDQLAAIQLSVMKISTQLKYTLYQAILRSKDDSYSSAMEELTTHVLYFKEMCDSIFKNKPCCHTKNFVE